MRQRTYMNRIYLTFAALVLLGAGCTQQELNLPSETTPLSQIDQVNFRAVDFEGNIHELSDYRGQVVFLDFWAGWCPFCVEELPQLQAIHEARKDVVVIGVHRTNTESLEEGKSFAKEAGVTYLLLQDPDDAIYTLFNAGRNFMPVGVLIDAEGHVQDRIFGPKTRDQILELLPMGPVSNEL